jgi:peptidoglycan L-alanyl-D-glutamate endopeptidase CwlK
MTEDQVSVARIKLLHPAIAGEVLDIYRTLLNDRINIRITSTFRSFFEQDLIYQQGRTKPGKIVTNAKSGESFHNYGLAFDFCLLINSRMVSWDQVADLNMDGAADWMQVVEAFETNGYTWGGRWKDGFKDAPHFQKNFGLTIHQCLAASQGGRKFPIEIKTE